MSSRRRLSWCVVFLCSFSLAAGGASAQLIGPLTEPPGGVTATLDGPTYHIGEGDGLDIEYTGIDFAANVWDQLYWGPLPNELKADYSGDLDYDNDPYEAPEILSFDSSASNLGGGVARWYGVTEMRYSSYGIWYLDEDDCRLTATTTDLSAGVLALTDATSLGLSDVGAVLNVTVDFNANLLAEFWVGVWDQFIDRFDGTKTYSFYHGSTDPPSNPPYALYEVTNTSADFGWWYTAEADLSLTKVVDTPTPTEGGTVVFTLTVSNAGPQALTAGSEAVDQLPAGLSYVSHTVSGNGSYDSGSGLWTLPAVAASGSATLQITALVEAGTAGTTISNSGEVTSAIPTDPDSTPGNGIPSEDDQDSADITVLFTSDVSITKDDGQTTAVPGTVVNYSITASNAGPDEVTGASVDDVFPAEISTVNWTCNPVGGATCTGSGSGDINDSVYLPVGGVAVYAANATVAGNATGTLSNTATITVPASHHDPDLSANSATDVDTILATDYGDAPDASVGPPWSYPTVLADDGARHTVDIGVYLGAGVDGEVDGQPAANARGDDLDFSDDEDGVSFQPRHLIQGSEFTVRVDASVTGYLNGWIDFNADGDWDDAGERIFTDQLVPGGVSWHDIQVPAGPEYDLTYIRLRLTSYNPGGALGYSGLASDGEVEDYWIDGTPLHADGFESGDLSGWDSHTP